MLWKILYQDKCGEEKSSQDQDDEDNIKRC